eukprot:153229-Amphidinium_carterae.1
MSHTHTHQRTREGDGTSRVPNPIRCHTMLPGDAQHIDNGEPPVQSQLPATTSLNPIATDTIAL